MLKSKMDWPELEHFLSGFAVPAGFSIEQLQECEVDSVIQCLESWYPDIAVGGESCHRERDFYLRCAFLKEGDSAQDVLPLALKQGDVFVGFLTLLRDKRAVTLTSRLAVLAPGVRQSGLAYVGINLLLQVARAVGAEMVYYQATLKTPHQQIIAEKMGFTLVGIMPACDRDMVRPGVVKRVYEALYAKVLAGREEVLVPPDEVLTPRTRRLFHALFEETKTADLRVVSEMRLGDVSWA